MNILWTTECDIVETMMVNISHFNFQYKLLIHTGTLKKFKI